MTNLADAHLIDCEVWVAMNESGKYVSDNNAENAVDFLRDNHGAVSIRTVKVTLRMSPPDIDGVTVRVPDTAGELTAAAE